MARAFILLLALFTPMAAAAQSKPTGAADVVAGYAGFLDEAPIGHGVFGGGLRYYLSPRASLGPELVYMRGPGFDRDLLVTGNLTIDFLLRPRGARAGAVTPFVVAGGGIMSHRDRFGATTFTSYEGTFTAGGGLRLWLTDRAYALGDVRVGWEPHTRITGGIGTAW